MLKNIGKYLKKINVDLKKLNKYQDNTTYGLDYLMNLMKKIITNQKKLKVLLMVVICYMEIEEIKMLN